MSVILLLLLTMLKIGCFAFGGGYAIIALLENEFVSKRKWIDHDEFLDVVAIAESLPRCKASRYFLRVPFRDVP